MPERAEHKTVFEIEREARWRVWLLFALLVALVFLCLWLCTAFIEVLVDWANPIVEEQRGVFGFSTSLRGLGIVFCMAALCSVAYWFSSRIGARARLLKVMNAHPLDPNDRFHQRLCNIVEEMRAATGSSKVEAFVVPTLGMNAFAFSDLKGGGCIGVTEGAVSRLSRQQLESVVAHEFAHVVSGDYVTATISCLLFGIYTAVGEKLEQAAVAMLQTRAALVGLAALGLRAIVGLAQIGSAFTNAAISRAREHEADAAAVRFTRDPVSLAQALFVMTRHPGGAGFIPSGLSPLCIRPTSLGTGSLLTRALATHPPVNDRIVRQLNIAHMSWADFMAQTADAQERFVEREHFEKAPGARPELGPDGAAALVAGMTATSAPASGPPRASSAPALAGPAPEFAMRCPSCGAGLTTLDYEGVAIHICRACAGRLVRAAEIQRILTRREMGFSEEQQRLADHTEQQGNAMRRAAVLARGKPQTTLIDCPKCGRQMARMLYSYEYAVQVDRCFVCDLTWFEKDELEVLQILIERRVE